MMRPSVGRSSTTGGRRSSAGGSGRTSLAPARIKHDNASNMGGRTRNSGGGRSSIGSVGSAGSARKRPVSRFRMTAPSSARRSSASSIRGNFGHDIIKEIRPLSDKSYMQREIKDIIEFLEEYSFPHAVSSKRMMSPTSKEFLEIFHFIYCFLDPDYKMAQKYEEEVIQIFKSIRYPFTISKSSLLSLGSPHSWPHVLGALHWLMEIVKYALAVDSHQLLFGGQGDVEDDEFSEEITESEIFFKFAVKSYEEFLDGSDTFEECESELAADLKKKNLGITDFEQLTLEEKRLMEELQHLEQEPNQLGALQLQLQGMKNDNANFAKYLQDLSHHKQMLEKKLEDVSLQVKEKELELSQSDEKNRHLEYQLANQELSAVDVQRIQSEARQLTSDIDKEDRDVQTVDQEIWSEEKRIAKRQEELEQKGSEFNSLARKLKLIPIDAENAGGIDFEMRTSFHRNPALMTDFINTIKPALQKLKTKMNDEVHEKKNLELMEEERLDQLMEMVENKEHELMVLERQVQKMEQDITNFKDKSKEDMQVLNAKLAELEETLKMLTTHGNADLAQIKAEVHELQERFEKRVTDMREEETSYQKFLLSAATTVLEHKTLMQEHFKSLVGKINGYHERLASLKVPEMPNLKY